MQLCQLESKIYQREFNFVIYRVEILKATCVSFGLSNNPFEPSVNTLLYKDSNSFLFVKLAVLKAKVCGSS